VKLTNSLGQRWGRITDAVLILLIAVWGLSGCSGTSPEDGVSSSQPTQTPVPLQASPLPPTWTASPPPTATVTATITKTSIPPTQTHTPEPTETLTADHICERFTLISSPEEGVSLSYAGYIGVTWENAPPDSVVVMAFLRGEEETLAQASPQSGVNTLFDLGSLPGWGSYHWTIGLFIEPYGEICQQKGEFFREPWWFRPIENPFAPPFAR
jgi:hypothetical protein